MIITRIIGTITDVVVDEATYQTATGLSADNISSYKYDGADWKWHRGQTLGYLASPFTGTGRTEKEVQGGGSVK